MRTKLFNHLAALFGLVLFGWALWVLYHELRVYHYQDIIRILRNLPGAWLLAALGLAFLDYLVLTGYDRLAFTYLHHPLPYKKIALTSFIGYAFSHNIGLTFLTGGSVRYRFYSTWGLSAVDIAKVILFCGLTFWLGFFLVGGFAFWLQPLSLPASLALPFHSLRWLGGLFLAAIALYLALCFAKNKQFKIRKVEFSLPRPGVALAQLAVSALDWVLVAGVLYVLLPRAAGLSFSAFLSIFLLAQIAGMVSQIPGGLGVFETVMLLLLEAYYPASVVLGTLLAFRGVYYLLPLGAAILLLGSHEFLSRREHIQNRLRVFGKWAPGLVPNLLAVTAFVGGTILLFSGSVPPVPGRLQWLSGFLPLPVMEISHFLGSMSGVGLLLLAQSLQRRLRTAYVLTACLLAAGVVFSICKGGDFEEAISLTLMLAAFLPAGAHFYRRSSLLSQRFTFGWLAAVVLALSLSIWLGLFAYKYVTYANNLWWSFSLEDGAPRFLRSVLGVFGAVLAVAVSQLLRPAPAARPALTPDDARSLERITASEPGTYAQLSFLPDKTFCFSENRQAVIMYAVQGSNWVAMGDPVGRAQDVPELIWRYKELCDHYEGRPVFFQVGDQNLPYFSDIGLTPLKIGEEARVPLAGFSLAGEQGLNLRRLLQQLEEKGLRFDFVPREKVPALLPALADISRAWLENHGVREKRFSLGSFHADYLRRYPAAIIRQEQKILGFANLWQGGGREEAAADLLRCAPEAPAGVLDFFITRLILWAQSEGFAWFNLGLAPLAGPGPQVSDPVWQALSRFLYRHGGNFQQLQELRPFLEKFAPVWEAKYLTLPSGLELPKVIAAITGLIAGA